MQLNLNPIYQPKFLEWVGNLTVLKEVLCCKIPQELNLAIQIPKYKLRRIWQLTCKGRMKLDIRESIEQISHKAEIAWPASILCLPRASKWSGLSSSLPSSPSDSSENLLARAFKASPLTEGQPLAVYISVSKGLSKILCSVIVQYFFGAFFPSSITLSMLRI